MSHASCRCHWGHREASVRGEDHCYWAGHLHTPPHGRDSKSSGETQSHFLSCDCDLQGVVAAMRQSCTGNLGTGLAVLGSPVTSLSSIYSSSVGCVFCAICKTPS